MSSTSSTSSIGSTSPTIPAASSSSSTYTSAIGQQIDSLVTQFTQSETNSKVTPLQNKLQQYTNLTNAYDTLSTKLTDFQSSLKNLQSTGTDDVFAAKACTSSDSSFVTATATGQHHQAVIRYGLISLQKVMCLFRRMKIPPMQVL